MSEQPWYRGGLRFGCTRCGHCCTGDPGFVRLTRAEASRLAHRLGLSLDRFRRRYLRRLSGGAWSLREKSDFDCIFYVKGEGCGVYQDRPRQCRTWPFWKSNLESPQSWGHASRGCPGMNRGRLVPLLEIEDLSRRDGTSHERP